MRNILEFFLGIVILAAVSFGFWFHISYDSSSNKPFNVNGETKVFTVKSGQGVKVVAKALKDDGLIKSDFFFQILASRSGQEKNIKAGAYELSAAMTAKEILEKLSSGRVINEEMEVTVIPGWTRRDVAAKVKEWGLGQESDLYSLAGEPFMECQKKSPSIKDYSKQFDFLADKPSCRGLEGYLFPDTYRLYKSANTEDLVLKMLKNFDNKLTPQMREDIKKQGKTIYEIVTMASVVEKEVRSEEDMRIVAGIFWNRINSGQALQSCASLAYILGVNKAIYSIEDTQTDSPYNTYQNQGLPPGPISNPSLEAIKSAIYPEKTDYFYFLSRSDNGETVFAKTYDDHLRNKEKYLK
jgi:UPF0755 protein